MSEVRETTTIIAPVPEAEPAVGELRARADPSTRLGIPAHVTLLGPFLPPGRIDGDVVARLERIFARHRAIDLTLTAVHRFPGVLYLALDPEDCCRAIAEDLASAWPELQPYRGAFESVIHHLTLARGLTPDEERDVEVQLSQALPIAARIDHAQLVAFDADAYERALAGTPGPAAPPARVLATLRFSSATARA